jgi:hypothetical protein
MQFVHARVLGIVLALASCQSSGHDRVAQTATQLDALCASAQSVKADAMSVASCLNGLVARADADPRPAFDAFQSSAKKLARSSTLLENRLTVAGTDSEKMFAEWVSSWGQLEDEDLKQQSHDRRERLSKSMKGVMAAMQPVVDEAKQYVVATNDLVTYLNLDLTPENLHGAEGRAKSHASSARSMGEKIDAAVEKTSAAARLFETSSSPAPKR